MSKVKYLIPDVSLLTTIPELSLKKLADKCKFVICHDVQEACLNNEDEVTVDVGLGQLTLKIEQDCVRYKFTPNASFEESVERTILTNTSPLTCLVEDTLVNKIENAYKELF